MPGLKRSRNHEEYLPLDAMVTGHRCNQRGKQLQKYIIIKDTCDLFVIRQYRAFQKAPREEI